LLASREIEHWLKATSATRTAALWFFRQSLIRPVARATNPSSLSMADAFITLPWRD
jgi:hypothetical protein